MLAELTVTASPRADAGWAGALAEAPASRSWVCTGRAARKVKCMAERLPYGNRLPSAALGIARGVLAALVGPAHLPPAPHRAPTSLGAPGAESSLSLDASQATRLTLWIYVPILEIAPSTDMMGDPSLGSWTSTCAHGHPDLLFPSSETLCAHVYTCVCTGECMCECVLCTRLC